MAVITVSRQFGSKGDEIATRVCELLGYRYFDKRMMDELASKAALIEGPMVDFREDDYKIVGLLDRLLGTSGPRTAAQLRTWTEDFRSGIRTAEVEKLDAESVISLIRGAIHAANKLGNVVIVGRCGQAVLKDQPGVLHVRIEAPLEARAQRIQKQENLTPRRRRS